MQRLDVQHLIIASVAAIAVALALADGGFEPTAYAAAGLIVWIAVLVGLAVGVLPRAEPPGAAVGAGLALAGLAAMMALSLAWASNDGDGFEDVVRTLAYLGAFVSVVLASRRGEARPWLAGLTIGLVAIGAIALLARFEPGPFGDPDADLAETLPAALGRLTYPIGYWNGLAAAMAGAIVLLSWFGTAGRTRVVRSLSVAALPAILLALWMTDSRGGMIAAAIAFVVLLLGGQGRSRMVANLVLGAIAGAVLIAIAETKDTLLNNPPLAEASDGHEMLGVTLLIVAATLAARWALDGRLERFAIPRDVGRIAVVGVVVVALGAAGPDRPDRAVRRVQGAADGRGARRRRRRPPAGRGQRPVPVLGDRGRRVRELPDRRGRRERIHALLVRAPGDPDPGAARALARLRDACRARDRRLRPARDLLRGHDRLGHPARARGGGGGRGGAGPGAAGGRDRGRDGRLDLGPHGGLRGDDPRRRLAHGAGDAGRAGPGAAATGRGAPPAPLRRRGRAAARRLDLDLRLRPAAARAPMRSTRAARPPTATTSGRRWTPPTTRSTCSRGRRSRAPSSRSSTSWPATSTRRRTRSTRRSAAPPTTTGCACWRPASTPRATTSAAPARLYWRPSA